MSLQDRIGRWLAEASCGHPVWSGWNRLRRLRSMAHLEAGASGVAFRTGELPPEALMHRLHQSPISRIYSFNATSSSPSPSNHAATLIEALPPWGYGQTSEPTSRIRAVPRVRGPCGPAPSSGAGTPAHTAVVSSTSGHLLCAMFGCRPNRINIIHKCAPLIEKIAAHVGGLDLVPDRMRKRRVHDRMQRMGLLGRRVAEARPDPRQAVFPDGSREGVLGVSDTRP